MQDQVDQIEERKAGGHPALAFWGKVKKILLMLWNVEYLPLFVLLMAYIVLNTYMNFAARYDQYLFSDMYGYFNRVFQIYNGNDKSIGSWVGFAPYYSRLLAEPYSVLKWLGLEKYFLEYVLCQNVFMSAVSGIALHSIAKQVSGSRLLGLGLTALYLFSYPHLYFNGFVLTEPFTVPLIIISVWLLFIWKNSYKIILCGVALAVAVGVRPSNGLLGLPFALYIGFSGVTLNWQAIKNWQQLFKVLFPKWIKAGLFSVAFFATLSTIMAENNRVSDGRMTGLTSHSGYNFLLGQSQAHRIFSTWDGITYVFVPASVAHHPENGTLRTNIPIYDSETFYEEGWKVLDAYPRLWLEHFEKYKYMFFDNLFPAVGDHPGFHPWMETFRYIVFYIFLFCGLVYISIKEKDVPKSVIAFFAAAFILPAASLYLFTVTHKYFFNFSYTLYVLFSIGIFSSIRHFGKYKKFIFTYIGVVVVGTAMFWGGRYVYIHTLEENVLITVTQNGERINSLNQQRKPVSQEDFKFDRLVFFEREELKHESYGWMGYRQNYFIDAVTEMEVLKAGTYTFRFFVDDAYEVYLNDDMILHFHGSTRMAENPRVRSVVLNEGIHKIRVKMYQRDGAGGLAGYYRREDVHKKPEGIIWEPKGGRGYPIGVDDPFTRFYAPVENN